LFQLTEHAWSGLPLVVLSSLRPGALPRPDVRAAPRRTSLAQTYEPRPDVRASPRRTRLPYSPGRLELRVIGSAGCTGILRRGGGRGVGGRGAREPESRRISLPVILGQSGRLGEVAWERDQGRLPGRATGPLRTPGPLYEPRPDVRADDDDPVGFLFQDTRQSLAVD
jgi:hypothetical protein